MRPCPKNCKFGIPLLSLSWFQNIYSWLYYLPCVCHGVTSTEWRHCYEGWCRSHSPLETCMICIKLWNTQKLEQAVNQKLQNPGWSSNGRQNIYGDSLDQSYNWAYSASSKTWSIDQSINPSINQSINQSVNQSIGNWYNFSPTTSFSSKSNVMNEII